MRDLIGTTLGHYRIVEKIGEGGMGEVYRARDERLDRDVAIKVLPESVAQDADRLARFEREAKLLASLNHANIATLHALEKEESQRFLVMELVEGESLAGVVARGAIPFDEALPIVLQIAKALETAHEHGVIHRDLKPANVMVDSEGQVKVLDFGLAKAFDLEGPGSQSPESIAESPTITADMTRAGALLGTAAYMSPEQARGNVVDKRVDIWAFGCVLYEMLTGTRPFGGTSSTEVLAAIIKEDPDWDVLPTESSAPIRRLLRRCLTKDPRDRIHDIADVRIVLQSLSSDEYKQHEAAVLGPIRAGWHTWLPWSLAALSLVGMLIIVINGAILKRNPTSSQKVVRTVIDLPDGTQLADLGFRTLNRPIRNEIALSPDGGTLVFSASLSDGVQPPRLYRRSLSQTEAIVIPGTEGASSPFFSPDGQWVAFWAKNELKKVSLDGGLPISIATYIDPTGLYPPMGGCWSSGGTIYLGTHLDGLQTVDAGGGQLSPLTVPDRSTEYAHRMPQVLPGGKAVLFTVAYSYLGARGHIQVLSLETGERKTVVDPGLDGRFVASGHLLFMQQGTLMAAPFDLDLLELTGAPVPVVEGVMHSTNERSGFFNSGAGQFSTSENGTMVFAAGGIVPEVRRKYVWVDLDSGVQTDAGVPIGPLARSRISPDGRYLAYSHSGITSGLWVFDLKRGTSTRLIDEGRVLFMCWTPSGKRIVFGHSFGGVSNLSWISRDGVEPAEWLTKSEYLQQPGTWAPDGRFLAYMQWRHSEGTSIWVLDIESRESKPFLHERHQYRFPDFSPDGKWLAYVSDESGRLEVWLTSFPDREQRYMLSNKGGVAPAWAPDGREIYYVSETRLMSVGVTEGESLILGTPRTLFDGPIPGSGPLRSYDITPDGLRLIHAVPTESETHPQPVRRLQVVLNWFEELERLVPTD
jgi:serine/threonine-protein kinase